jgi:hypothetical protein
MPKIAPVDYDTVVPGAGDKDPNQERATPKSNKEPPPSSGKYMGASVNNAEVGPRKQLAQEDADAIFKNQCAIRASALETSMATVDSQSAMIPNFSGMPVFHRPLIMPKQWPLNILFFRKIYTRLRLTHPKGQGVDVEVFQSRLERLFKIFGNKNVPPPSVLKSKDKHGSGWITWQECAECWRDGDFNVHLSCLEQVYFTFDQLGCASSILGWLFSTSIMTAIAISSCMFLLSSMPAMKSQPCPRCEPVVHGWFADIESIACILFTAEYLVRFLTVNSVRVEVLQNEDLLDIVTKDVKMKLGTGFGRTVAFVREPSNMIDFLAILPCHITAILPPNTNLTVLRLIRLSRVFRVLKMGNLNQAKDILTTTMEYSWPSLSMVLFIIIMWILVFSVLVYMLEMGEWS